jgi:hypothetical protein
MPRAGQPAAQNNEASARDAVKVPAATTSAQKVGCKDTAQFRPMENWRSSSSPFQPIRVRAATDVADK